MANANILTETVCSIHEAARALPTKPHHSTVFRWMRRGRNGVRLESYQIGRQWLTSHEALHRFLERTQPQDH